jgi:hypothetical protein
VPISGVGVSAQAEIMKLMIASKMIRRLRFFTVSSLVVGYRSSRAVKKIICAIHLLM